jgi:hypothetical protein
MNALEGQKNCSFNAFVQLGSMNNAFLSRSYMLSGLAGRSYLKPIKKEDGQAHPLKF